MPELNEEQRKQLDNNIKAMLENGASEEDVMSYSRDFNEKYGKKKVETTPSPSPSPLVGGTFKSTPGSSAQLGNFNYLSGQQSVNIQPATTENIQSETGLRSIGTVTRELINETPDMSGELPSSIEVIDGQPVFKGFSKPTAQQQPSLKAAGTSAGAVQTDQKNFQQPKDDRGFVEKNIATPFAYGTAGLISSISKAPAFLLDMENAMVKQLSKNLGVEIPAVNSEQLSQMLGDANILGQLHQSLDADIKERKKRQEEYFDKSMQAYFTSGKEGDLKKGVELLTQSVSESLPTTFAIMLTGGLIGGAATFGVSAATFAAQKNADIEESGVPISDEAKISASLLSGLSETASEQLFGAVKYAGPLFRKAFGVGGKEAVEKVANDVIKQSYGKAFARYMGSSAEEVASEVANTVVQNAIDIYSGVNPNKNLDDGLFETIMTAGAMSKAMGAPVLINDIAITREGKKKAAEIKAKKDAVQNDVTSPNINPETKMPANNILKSINEMEFSLAMEEKEKMNNLPDDKKAEVEALNNQIKESEKIINDPNISDETRDAVVQNNESIQDKIDEIFATSKKETTEVKQEPVVEQQGALTPEETEELQSLQSIQSVDENLLQEEDKARLQELTQKQGQIAAPVTQQQEQLQQEVVETAKEEQTPPATEQAEPLKEAKPVTEQPVVEDNTVELPGQEIAGRTGLPRKMVKDPKTGEWKQEIGGELSTVGKSLQEEAEKAYNEKIKKKPATIQEIVVKENRKLPPEQKEIEAKFAKDLDENYEQRKAEYLAKNGNVFDTDRARELSPDYANDPTISQAVHIPAREFVTRVYKEELAKPAPEGKANVVVVTSGGSGAGKTMAVNAAKDNAHIVLDTNLSRYDDAVADIEEILAAGKQAQIDFVYREPKAAMLDGVIGGRNRGGRTVPLNVALDSNKGSLETIKKLSEKYKDNPDVIIRYFNNSEKGKAMQPFSLDDVKQIENDYEQLKKELQDEIDRRYEAGELTEKQYKGFSAVKEDDAGGVQKVVGGKGKENVGKSQEGVRGPGITAGLTPYANERLPRYNTLNQKIQEAKEAKDKKAEKAAVEEMRDDLSERIKRIIPGQDFKIKPATGLWQGGSEPSFFLEFDEVNDDVLAAIAKVADEFDQDEVHIRSNDVDPEADAMVMQPDGSYVVPSVVINFNNPVDFNEIMTKFGFGGATGLGDNTILLYSSDLPAETGKTERQILEDFLNKVNKLKDESKGNVRDTKEGYTRLRRYSRDGREGVSKSYKQAISDLSPSKETAERLKSNPEATKVGVWANRVLSGAQKTLISAVSKLNPKIGKIDKVDGKYERVGGDKKTVEKLTAVGKMFDNMSYQNKSKPVMDAYKTLVDVVLKQYKNIPIKVKPNSMALKLPDGSITWVESYNEPYKNSKEVIADIENNNNFVFFATNPGTFGTKGIDYTGHPMLEPSGLQSVEMPVYEAVQNGVDENGKPMYVAGNIIPGEKAKYDLLNNDAFRVVHDYYAHASTGSQFGPRGEDVAWAAHVSTILKEKGLTDQQKLKAIWALTSETRGQNTWVNFVNERNKMVTYELDRARKLEADGKIEEADEIRKQFVYPNGIQFSDQKIGLLPSEALLLEYEDNPNDKELKRIMKDNPVLTKQLNEESKKQDTDAVKKRIIAESDQLQREKRDEGGEAAETGRSDSAKQGGKKQEEVKKETSKKEQKEKEPAKKQPVEKEETIEEEAAKKGKLDYELLDEEEVSDSKKEDDPEVVKKFYDDIELFKKFPKTEQKEKKFIGVVARAYEAKEAGKIKKTTYTEMRNRVKAQLGAEYEKTMKQYQAKMQVSKMMENVKDFLLGKGYKNITLGTTIPVTPKNIADLIDLTTKLIHRGIDAGYGISKATSKALQAIKGMPAYKKLVDGNSLNDAEFEKMVDTQIAKEMKAAREKAKSPESYQTGEKERKTTKRMKEAPQYKEVVSKMTNEGRNYIGISNTKMEKFVDEIVATFEREGMLEDVAVEMLKNTDVFGHDAANSIGRAAIGDRLMAMAEAEGNAMQKDAMEKLAAELIAKRAGVVTNAAQILSAEQIVAKKLPLSEAGMKAYMQQSLSELQNNHMSAQQKNDVHNASVDIKSLLLDPEVKAAVDQAVDEKLNEIAEKTKGKEWIDNVDSLDDLKIDLNDC